MTNDMRDTDLFSPTSMVEAVNVVADLAPALDSPTQHRLRTRRHLEDTFGSGRRRPEWVWAARDSTGSITGGLAGIGSQQGAPFGVDLMSLPRDPDQAARLLTWAPGEARGHGFEEVAVFAPPDAGAHDVRVASSTDALVDAGWRVFVERCHYEFTPVDQTGGAIGSRPSLRLERLTDANDPRLAAVHRDVMAGTLDAHDAATVGRVGFDAACEEALALLLDSDPVDCLRLAFDAADRVVGLVSFRAMLGGRALVLFVGVGCEHRGHHYAAELVRLATHALVAEGATVLIADTDTTNQPMVRAFRDAGWPRTETRIDFVPG
ncbi:MAG: GNAT family N-acetyltransferase [Humibacillus sp.]|nr:GNAT family N-acetyltransferase [Humibacillus sp.]MDN5778112.1 GNAT family N-acetyltransferase [Humibacillus sp.]